jgi:hypothetical protein
MNMFINLYESIFDEILGVYQKVIVYPGRFHPFHKGHYNTYNYLKNKFSGADVYIATSEKTDPEKSPFSFDDKQTIMLKMGVDPSDIVKVKNPYSPVEITSLYNIEDIILIIAVSEKDMLENPRFSFKPKKDGSPSYFKKYEDDLSFESAKKHGYIYTTPTFTFKLLGNTIKSASEIRDIYIDSDESMKIEIIKNLYNKFDKTIKNIFDHTLL